MKKLVVIIFLIMFAGCEYTPVMSTTGHLENIKRVNNLDKNVSTNLNNFGIKLYNEIYKDDENIFISPASIYLALSIAYNGANGQTKEEMSRLLNITNLSLDEFNELNRDLQYLILGYKNSKFELANSIWINEKFSKSIKEDFINRNNKYYGTTVSNLDFNDSKSADIINDWVKDNTKGRIKKILDNGIDPTTVMHIINTIYFKSEWKDKFATDNTKTKPFTNSNGTKYVKMMSKTGSLGYTENDDLQGVLLPYIDNNTAMFVLLPKEGKSINITNKSLSSLLDKMKDNVSEVSLSMPRVKVEYNTSLIKPLDNLGIKDAFSTNADFSDMVKGGGVCISEITHKTFLDINEEGTEASAATNIGINYSGPSLLQNTMNVDHPFVVGIVDLKSDAILFIGKIFDPRK